MFHRHPSAALFGLCTLVSLLLLAGSSDRTVQSLKHLVYYAWSPAGFPLVSQMDQWGQFGARLAGLIRADQRARSAEDRLVRESLNRSHFMSLEDENHRLRNLLQLPPWPGYRTIAARVWARDSSDWFHTLLVQPGQRGVTAGSAVIAVQNGRAVALGQVRDVMPDGKARVLLITDPFSALSAETGRTGEQGLVEGRGADRVLLNYLFPQADVAPGDDVHTSGLGDVYPPRVLIGRVERVDEAEGAGFKRAVVRPSARMGFLREVLILERADPPGRAP